jgi:hypothetical protein
VRHLLVAAVVVLAVSVAYLVAGAVTGYLLRRRDARARAAVADPVHEAKSKLRSAAEATERVREHREELRRKQAEADRYLHLGNYEQE